MTGLEVDLKLVADKLETIFFVLLVPHAFVVWDVGVRLPLFELHVGGTVIHFVVCIGVAVLAAGVLPFLLLILLLALLLLVMPALSVGFDRAVGVRGRRKRRLIFRLDPAGLGHVVLDQAADRGKYQRHRVCLQLGGRWRWRATHLPVGIRRSQEIQHLFDGRAIVFVIVLELAADGFKGGTKCAAMIMLFCRLHSCHDCQV